MRKTKKMLEQEFVTRMETLMGEGDTEGNHVMADTLLCELLKQLGFKSVVDLYEKVDKWYG